jgi:hypothetical protein
VAHHFAIVQAELMDAVDEDGDRVLSKAEFMAGARRSEKFADVVSHVDQDEFEAAVLTAIWDGLFDEEQAINPDELLDLIRVYGKVGDSFRLSFVVFRRFEHFRVYGGQSTFVFTAFRAPPSAYPSCKPLLSTWSTTWCFILRLTHV